MKLIYFTEFIDGEFFGFTPFNGKEQVYGTDLLIINGDRHVRDPEGQLPEDTQHYLSYDREHLRTFILGLTVRRSYDDYLLLEPKILERIEEGEKIVLFSEYFLWNDEIEFMLYLKTKKNFDLHIVKEIRVDFVSNNYHELLRVFPFKDCASICYMNGTEYADEDESSEVYEKPIYEELENVLKAISNLDKTDMVIYDHEMKKYVPCKLPAYHSSSMFEFITPNADKDICQKLYEYRKEYARNNKLNYNKKPCSECECKNECTSVCDECDGNAAFLWEQINDNCISDYDCDDDDISAKLNGIDRMRIGTDGEGIRSLILMAGCPLSCKYCGNKKYKDIFPDTETLSVSGMERFLHCDAIYFEATGGGLTFGGGEPLMQPDFIHEICRKYPRWSVNVQTSLCCEPSAIEVLAGDIDRWYVDIKDMDPDIYKSYTGMDIWTMLENLKLLSRLVPAEKITVRVPLIENYNTENDVRKSVKALKAMGFTDIEEFRYTVF